MIYVQEALISSHDRQAFADLNSVQQFLAEHGNALANAIYQLGGASISGSVSNETSGALKRDASSGTGWRSETRRDYTGS
jgi:hypothetical protein